MIDFNNMNEALKVASLLSQRNYDVKFFQFYNFLDFYSDILKYWQNTRSAIQENMSPRNEIFWNNHNIIIYGKAPSIKAGWKKHLRVEDLLDNNSNFKSSQVPTSFLLIIARKNFVSKSPLLFILLSCLYIEN